MERPTVVMQVLLLSEEFHLDELISLEYLLEAHEQVTLFSCPDAQPRSWSVG
jgi:hypothetical protein